MAVNGQIFYSYNTSIEQYPISRIQRSVYDWQIFCGKFVDQVQVNELLAQNVPISSRLVYITTFS